MQITEIHVYSVDLPVKNGPYTSSNEEIYALDSTIVELVTNTGLKGYGECCPIGPTYAPEHALGARAALAQLSPQLIGENPLNLFAVHRSMNRHLNGHNYAKAAIDIALWDLAGKQYNTRICDLIGGAQVESVPSYFTTGTVPPDEAARIAIEKRNEGFKRLQIKVGGRPIEVDIETIRKVWEAVGSNMRLSADANRDWCTRDAIFASNALQGVPVVFEQPCDTIEETRIIRKQVQHPIYLDESTTSIASVTSAIGTGLCDGFGFKLTRLGGISGLKVARDICKASNIPHTCDDAWGGDILAAACLHVGATVDTHLNEGVWIAQPYIDGHYDEENGITIDSGNIRLPTGPGLGVTPNLEKFGTPIASYT